MGLFWAEQKSICAKSKAKQASKTQICKILMDFFTLHYWKVTMDFLTLQPFQMNLPDSKLDSDYKNISKFESNAKITLKPCKITHSPL